MSLRICRDYDELVVGGIYVDDLMTAGTSAAAVQWIFEVNYLQIIHLGRVHKVLGIRRKLSNDGGYHID
uniref:Reverse transcriptase Ty1/copia-type domain-containing protein n=1 Tax=Peronospora matthiolae TaxID=2874970 RepID=A0AAV1TL00_9STRA